MAQNILIVDDDNDICITLSKILTKRGYEVNIANNSSVALNEIKKQHIDLILLDVWLEGSKKNGIELLKIIKNFNPNTHVILISGHANIEIAVDAMKKGAFYFIEKPFKSQKLFLLIERALENSFLKNKYESFKENYDDDQLIGNSSAINILRKKIKQIASTNARVLISGESGTGKKLVARLIHNLSNRNDKPFVSINCALLNDKNFDKSFFGVFNDTDNKLGYIQKASGGTIYLKEICDMGYSIQGKFTNFLQKEVYSTNAEKGDFSSNIRFISGTDKNINKEVEKKNLRKDLLYRVNVATLNIPSINERREDIPTVIDYFISKKEKETLKKVKLTDDTYASLQSCSWPGNVRQIKNFIDWLYIMHKNSIKKNESVNTKMLPRDLFTDNQDINFDNKDKALMNLPIKDARKYFEKKYLLNQVNRFGGNISKTANFIGMERSALHRKIKEIGIKK